MAVLEGYGTAFERSALAWASRSLSVCALRPFGSATHVFPTALDRLHRLASMSAANLHGVWAKWKRAVEQLESLDADIRDFGKQPNPYTVHAHIDYHTGRHSFQFFPAWSGAIATRWGAIIGEIVHDYRSALDNLVWQLVILNGGKPDDGHSFPLRGEEPLDFRAEMRREWKDRRGRSRHGPLFGLSDQAVAIIEACQPYKGQNFLLLGRLHDLWNTDKHRHLLPINLVGERPEIIPADGVILRRDDRFAGGAHIVAVALNPHAHVEVKPQVPTDVTLRDGSPVVENLKEIGKLIHIAVLSPCADLFSGLRGIGAI